jgi:histidine triad (HIT) family protein
MANTADSIFTKIIKREIPAKIRFEDDDFIVIDDLYPKAPVHVLIIPKIAYESLEAVPSDDHDFHHKLLAVARQVAKQLGISDNYKLFMNVGKQVQDVHHLHLHLMGGYSKEQSQVTFQE